MKSKQFEKLGKQLLPIMPDYVCKGSLIFHSPLDHILKGICFEPSGFDKDAFYANYFVLPLYIPQDYLSFNFGDRLGFGWEITSETILSDLMETIKKKALPILNKVNDLDSFIRTVKTIGYRKDPYLHQALFYTHALRSDVKAAEKAYNKTINLLDGSAFWHSEVKEEADLLYTTLNKNPKAAIELLTKWEKHTVSALKLEQYHECATL